MANRAGRNHYNQFSQVPKAQIPRSSFDRSCGLKTAVDASFLAPIYCEEVLPGDTVSLRASLFGRLATPLKPILDNMVCQTFFFFVPNRLVWDNWQRFNGEQDNPDDSTDYSIPVLQGFGSGFNERSLADYFGLPMGPAPDATAFPVNALPFRAYNLIWNEWFRDQNLQDSAPVPKDDGPDDASTSSAFSQPRRRNKKHDYFTSCLPWPQKGDPVTVPVGGYAPIVGDDTISGNSIRMIDRTDPAQGLTWVHASSATENAQFGVGGPIASNANNIFADLGAVSGFTINQLRQSFQIQRLLERDARGGTRYTEIVRSHFGVVSPDARLQRPEFLGGGTTAININPVPQTQGSDTRGEPSADTPQGNLAAYGTVAASGHGFTKSFTEHGYIIGLVNFRADLTYQQGIRRMWSRRTRFDFFWPALSHLGEMAVLNKEIYAQGTSADDDVFGYQEAWADYRYAPSQVTSILRSTASEPLDYWHLAQDFGELPTLSETFIQDDPPIDRIIAVPSEPHFLLDVWFKQRWARPMPLYGVPGLIDHF